jgi:hypothetical protein
MVIRSYRKAFNYERRLYRVQKSDKGDHWEVPGSPRLLAIGYFAAILSVLIVLSFIPPFSIFMDMLKPLMYPAIALGVAWYAIANDFDGRMGHAFLRDWLIYQWANRPKLDRSLKGWTKIHIKADQNTHELQHGTLRGPGLVDFSMPVRLKMRCGEQTIESDTDGQSATLVLFPGERVNVRP